MTLTPGTDFDFLIGEWNVHHRRLKTRLKGSKDWQEFEGSMTAYPTLDGLGNFDDNIINLPEDPYRAISMRSFDLHTATWAIWWLDGRTPHDLDVPVIGQFNAGVGLFYAADIVDGLPIKVRFMWTKMDTSTPRWEQAFSGDDGATWETNWNMDFS